MIAVVRVQRVEGEHVPIGQVDFSVPPGVPAVALRDLLPIDIEREDVVAEDLDLAIVPISIRCVFPHGLVKNSRRVFLRPDPGAIEPPVVLPDSGSIGDKDSPTARRVGRRNPGGGFRRAQAEGLLHPFVEFGVVSPGPVAGRRQDPAGNHQSTRFGQPFCLFHRGIVDGRHGGQHQRPIGFSGDVECPLFYRCPFQRLIVNEIKVNPSIMETAGKGKSRLDRFLSVRFRLHRRHGVEDRHVAAVDSLAEKITEPLRPGHQGPHMFPVRHAEVVTGGRPFPETAVGGVVEAMKSLKGGTEAIVLDPRPDQL